VNIKITDEAMTSDTTPHSTRPARNGWAVTWLPGRVLTRNQAITAMVLAETVAGGVGDHTDKRWPRLPSRRRRPRQGESAPLPHRVIKRAALARFRPGRS
jgi:hypothetical protein